MEKVRLEGVTKLFGSVTVVSDVNMQVQNGEFRVIVGPSGSGKTTLLRLIAGLEKLSKGHIYINGKLVDDIPPKDRNIAMVFQNYALYPHLSVEQNIGLPLKVRKMPPHEIDRAVKDISELLHISHLLKKKPGQTSGGEQQRVALARALVRSPEVFLLDEPLSNLDAKLRVEARGLLKRLQKELDITTVFVTHDQSEALSLASVVSVMNGGRIIESGDPQRIYSFPQHLFTATFIGSPPMNVIEGTITEEGGKKFFSCESLKLRIANIYNVRSGQKVKLGIRPEDVRLEGDLQAKVTVFEPMGSTALVTLNLGGHEFVVQTTSGINFDAGDMVSVGFPSHALHLFNEEGTRLPF